MPRSRRRCINKKTVSLAAKGTTPLEGATEEQSARWVRDMFGRVAPRYDLLNHVLSGNVDRLWRRKTVEVVDAWLRRPEAAVLDLACGTCDLLQALETRDPRRSFGSDFCHPMLTAAQRKRLRSPLFEADALQLPLRPESFDLVTCAFGFRNFANYRRGLEEIRRVLKPGGAVAILEFSTPPNAAFAAVYRWYSMQVLPRVAGWLSGDPAAYTYLPESVRKFPTAEVLAAEMRDTGFEDVRFHRMTFGIVALHVGVRA